jgi:hypothetical protein
MIAIGLTVRSNTIFHNFDELTYPFVPINRLMLRCTQVLPGEALAS